MIVEVENLSKKYLIAHEHQNPYASLKEIISDFIHRSAKRLLHPFKAIPFPTHTSEDFWALRNINLQIQQGDKIALLGRNGAGKSTLLKLISRITEPTTGKIKICGRVSSLLEVGTGFHPDLTGRENILLNGAIMGMTYQEMKKKFDEIVAFADVEKFLDTPIKRYSSGMYMRLGFAVAAHLDSDLLIVDEVLAVGDYQFQEKCLKKMSDIGAQGTTVIFVSHNINAVMGLCNKGVLLDKGELIASEPIDQCVGRYLRNCPAAGLEWLGNVGDEHVRVYQASLQAPHANLAFFYQNEETHLDVNLEILKPDRDLYLGFSVLNSRNVPIARSLLCDKEEHKHVITTAGLHHLSFHLDLSLFHPGEYQIRLDCGILNRKRILYDEVLLKFAVYTRQETDLGNVPLEKDGISLGNRWKVQPHRKEALSLRDTL